MTWQSIQEATRSLEAIARDVAKVRQVELFRKRVRGGRGYLRIENPLENSVFEADTLTCSHCGTIVVLNKERKRARNWCRHCNCYVCDRPGCNIDCNPQLQGVELALKYAGTDKAGQPFLPRGYDGSVLFDTRLRDKERIY